MINILNKNTKNRKWYINLCFCIFTLTIGLFLPNLFSLVISSFIKNDNICSVIAYILTIFVFILMYYKDLIDEAKNLKKNFKSSLGTGFKYYIVGLMAMMFFNIIIASVLKDVSSNENQVRDMLYNSPLYTMLCISIFAPLEEELIFRKSLQPLFKRKILYALVCGFTFGFAHLMTNFLSNIFVISDLLYLLPYGSLGFVFGCMDFETKSTFTSIIMHSIHNTFTGLLLLLLYFSGVL